MKTELQVKAIKLKKLLDMYSRNNHYAMQMKVSLEEVLNSAISGELLFVENLSVNLTKLFMETDLGNYRDLEEAYAQFDFEITSGNRELLNWIKKVRNKNC